MFSDFYIKKKKRKPFSIRTKKIEWLLASGKRKALEEYMKTRKFDTTTPSKCRECKTPLVWKGGKYNFDHKDNNPANNSQSNCHLLCRNCHGEHTKIEKRKVRGILGEVVGHKTIKRKPGYKKPKAKQTKLTASKKKRSYMDNIFGI